MSAGVPAASQARPRIAVLDYGIGNLRSAEKALQHVGADAFLSDDHTALAAADAMVLPGVGAFGRSMEALRERGLDQVAVEFIDSGRPFLGICVGMQMLHGASEESPGSEGLGVLHGDVVRLPEGVKLPQMQWNRVKVRPTASKLASALFDGLGEDPWMYFVHTFAPEITDDTIATCDYGGEVSAATGRDNVVACQFHPEKSSAPGLKLLGNFVDAVAADSMAGSQR